ncbi:hypothetical protein N9383_00425 [Granulosicoccus sp.]|nr:hypothetical protein [Granulosicoccus sp.]
MMVTCIASLGACSSSDDGDTQNSASNGNSTSFISTDETISYGFASTHNSITDSARIVRISLTDGNTVDGQYPDIESQIAAFTDDNSLYQIGRSNDTLTKFSASDTSIFDYQISVSDLQVANSDPRSIAFVNSDLAYLTRFSSDSVLIIDPTPAQLTSESLITGEIDLAVYNRGNGESLDLPDMTDAVVVDDKLFVLLENLDNGSPALPGYVAVIDTRTGLEISTGQGVVPLQGIELQSVNPASLQYNEDSGLLYVVGRGNNTGDESVSGDAYSGGIEVIDPLTYQTRLAVDDGTAGANNGFFVDAVVINESLGYVVTQEGDNAEGVDVNNVRSFNTQTGAVSEPVAGTDQLSITSIALGPDNHVWVGVQDDTPGFLRIDIDTGEIADERVATQLIPDDIVFIEVEQ